MSQILFNIPLNMSPTLIKIYFTFLGIYALPNAEEQKIMHLQMNFPEGVIYH